MDGACSVANQIGKGPAEGSEPAIEGDRKGDDQWVRWITLGLVPCRGTMKIQLSRVRSLYICVEQIEKECRAPWVCAGEANSADARSRGILD